MLLISWTNLKCNPVNTAIEFVCIHVCNLYECHGIVDVENVMLLTLLCSCLNHFLSATVIKFVFVNFITLQSPAWRLTTLLQFVGPCRWRVWSTSTPLCRIEPFADSTVQTVNHRWSSVSGRSSTVQEQAARQCYVSQFVDDLPATTEAHTVPAVIPRHYHMTLS